MNSVIESLLNRKSIRRYKDKSIDEETLNIILEAGIRTPSAGNLQHYSLVVIDDPKQKAALQKACGNQRFIGKAAVCIAALVDKYRLKLWFELSDAKYHLDEEDNLFAGDLFISYWDAVIALHNVVVAAESLGLGTCYIGNFLNANVQEMFNAPEHVFPAGLVTIGYPDEEPNLSPRLPLEAVVHRNFYQTPTSDDIKKHFRIKDQDFEKESDERKKEFAEKGIHNEAQAVSSWYSREFIVSSSKKMLENIKRAKINLTHAED